MASKPESQTGGVKPMTISGPHWHERDRVNWTDAEREWRKKWIKDQILSPDEPRRVPELEKELRNPIRRFFAIPSSWFYRVLEPRIGHHQAMNMRIVVPKLLGFALFSYYMYYYIKYNKNTWESRHGFQVITNRPKVVPGMDGYPYCPKDTKPSDYDVSGFNERKVFLS